jgi:hypothetical protein
MRFLYLSILSGVSCFEKEVVSVLCCAKPLALLLAVSCLVSGCRQETVATVDGTVKVDGTVLNAGWVVFRNEKSTLLGVIEHGGRYVLSHRGTANLPCGEYGVVLVPPEPKNEVDPITGAVRPGQMPDERLYPVRCRAMESSGVRQTIGPGHQVVDIEFRTGP